MEYYELLPHMTGGTALGSVLTAIFIAYRRLTKMQKQQDKRRRKAKKDQRRKIKREIERDAALQDVQEQIEKLLKTRAELYEDWKPVLSRVDDVIKTVETNSLQLQSVSEKLVKLETQLETLLVERK